MTRSSLNIIHWNSRGIRNKIPEIQSIAINTHILCLQETLITSASQFNISGFKHVNLVSSSSNVHGLSTLIHNDYQFSIVDCNALALPSVEVLGIRLYCSLAESLYIFNIYHHPGINTPFSFYRKLFGLSSSYKYVIFLSDFNARHSDWHDFRTDSQGENISRACDAFGLVVLNNGSPTFLSSPNFSSSIIDISIVI